VLSAEFGERAIEGKYDGKFHPEALEQCDALGDRGQTEVWTIGLE
jgi:hypothetical protein